MRATGALAALLVAAAISLAGCGTLDEARLAADETKAPPGERVARAADLGLRADGPLTIEKAVKTALAAHPSVVRARRNAAAAEARAREAEGAYWPQVSASADHTFGTQNPDREGKNTLEGRGTTGFGFRVSWLIFDFGRTPALVRNAAKSWLAAQEDLRSAEVDASLAAREAFFDLEKQQGLLEVSRETVRQFELRLDQVRELVRVGARIPYDLTKAQVDLGNARLALVQARDAVRTSQAKLANALGLAELTDFSPEAPAPELPAYGTFEQAFEEAGRAHPALAAARAREEAAKALLDAQVAALYPSFSVSLGFSGGGGSTPFPWNLDMGPSVSWTVFDGLQNLYTIDEAAASLRATRAARVSVEQQVWLEVRTSWIAIENARERLDLADLVVRQAEENLALARGLYEVGNATAIDLTDAQQALVKARSDRVQARADHGTAIARLKKSIGRSL